MMTDNGSFTTQNTALAAYLKTEGFMMQDMVLEEHPASFVFEDGQKLRECIRLWQLGKAICNVNIFFMNYRHFIKKLRLYSPLDRGRDAGAEQRGRQ